MHVHNSPHPSNLLKEDVLPALDLTPELALRLAKWIPAPTAIMWLQMQADYGLWQAEHPGRVLDVTAAQRHVHA